MNGRPLRSPTAEEIEGDVVARTSRAGGIAGRGRCGRPARVADHR